MGFCSSGLSSDVCFFVNRTRRFLRVCHRLFDGSDVELWGIDVWGAGAVGPADRESDLCQPAVLWGHKEQGTVDQQKKESWEEPSAELLLHCHSSFFSFYPNLYYHTLACAPTSSCDMWEVVRQVQHSVGGVLLLEPTDIRATTRLLLGRHGFIFIFIFCLP